MRSVMSVTNTSLILLAIITLGLVEFSLAVPAYAADNSSPLPEKIGAPAFSNLDSEDWVDIQYQVLLSDQYKLLGSVSHNIVLNIQIHLANPKPVTVSIKPTFDNLKVVKLPPKANVSLDYRGSPPTEIYEIKLPNQTGTFEVTIIGKLAQYSLLDRNVIEVQQPFVIANASFGKRSDVMLLTPPPESKIFRISSDTSSGFQTLSISGRDYLLLDSMQGLRSTSVVYEPVWRDSFLLILFISVISVTATISLMAWRLDVSRLNGVRRLMRRSRGGLVKSRTWFVLFILTATAMITLSFAVGPNPRPMVYVVGGGGTAVEIEKQFSGQNGFQIVTTDEEIAEAVTLANLGVIRTSVITDFTPPNALWAKHKLYPIFDSMHRIIVVKSYADKNFLSELESLYGDKLIVVDTLSQLDEKLERIYDSQNPLGLVVPESAFRGVAMTMAFASFLLPFFGLALISSKLSESGSSPRVSGLVEAVSYSFFIFFFILFTYMASSVLLGLPLGLHAGSSDITAVGMLGFGGGTRPRMTAGVLGFLLGVFTSHQGRLKVSKYGLIGLLLLAMLLAADPFSGGRIFYEFSLAFSVGGSDLTSTENMFNQFFRVISQPFGSWVSTVWFAQRGQTLYYAGVIGFAFFAKMSKNTATMAIFICAFLAGDGIVRVADMIPMKSMGSVLPGIVTGVILSIILGGVNLIETTLMKISRSSN